MISSCIDWLSITFVPREGAAKFILSIENLGGSVGIKPRYGYDMGLEYENGIKVYWSIGRDDMGCHVVMSGKVLLDLATIGVPSRTLLDRAISMNAKITRLDLAIDAINEGVNPHAVYSAALAGETRGTAQKVEARTGIDGGITVYIGSRESDKFARLYDKGIESGQGGDWKRLELELKGDVAKQYARILSANPDMSIASFAWSTAKKMLTTEHGNYQTYGKESEIVSMPKIEKVTDTERWIHTQIIPIIEKYVKTHPESTVYDELIDALIRAKTQKVDNTTDNVVQ